MQDGIQITTHLFLSVEKDMFDMAIPYELDLLDELISETIHPKKLLNENLTNVQLLREAEYKILAEITRFRKRLKPAAYSFEKEKHRELYIRQHQSCIIHLMDKLYHYLMPKSSEAFKLVYTDTPLIKLYKTVFAECRQALEDIQISFHLYFNYEEKIPDYQWMQMQEEFAFQIPLAKKQLTKIKTDKRLINILLSFLYTVTDFEQYPSICYHKMIYIKDLLAGLANLNNMKNITRHCPHLDALLVYLNFNETAFKDYFVDTICENVNSKIIMKEKLERLSFYYKEISQMHTRPDTSLRPLALSVKEDLKSWVAGEIKYLEKTQNLGIIVPGQFKDPGYKKGVWYTYTIEELALLQRIQYEAGFISNTKIRPMIEDFSKIAHVESQHNISAKNLYNLFYNIDLNTITSLNDKLFMLINHLKKLEGQLRRKSKEKQTLSKK